MITQNNRLISAYHSGITENEVILARKYDTDIGALMEVLEKICRHKIGDGVTYVDYAYPRTFGMISLDDGKIMVRLNGFQLFKADTLHEALYDAIIDLLTYLKDTTDTPELLTVK